MEELGFYLIELVHPYFLITLKIRPPAFHDLYDIDAMMVDDDVFIIPVRGSSIASTPAIVKSIWYRVLGIR